MPLTRSVDVVVVGSGFSGLGVAAALASHGVDYVVLEKGPSAGAFWHGGHKNLSLHSPYHAMPHDANSATDDFPMFKNKAEVVAYLSAYADLYGATERTQFGTEVTRVTPPAEGSSTTWTPEPSAAAASNASIAASAASAASTATTALAASTCDSALWTVRTASGESFRAKYVAVCTGFNAHPHTPANIPGQGDFGGTSVHSWHVRSCEAFRGKRVLLVGTGNSAAELAVDLVAEGAAAVDMLAGAPRYFIETRDVGRVASLFSLLGLATADLVNTIHGLDFGTEPWWDHVISEDRFFRFLSFDLSARGIRTPPPLEQPPPAADLAGTAGTAARAGTAGTTSRVGRAGGVGGASSQVGGDGEGGRDGGGRDGDRSDEGVCEGRGSGHVLTASGGGGGGGGGGGDGGGGGFVGGVPPRVPVFDEGGCIGLIRSGQVRILQGPLERFTTTGVVLASSRARQQQSNQDIQDIQDIQSNQSNQGNRGETTQGTSTGERADDDESARSHDYDAVVYCTGFRHGLEALLGTAASGKSSNETATATGRGGSSNTSNTTASTATDGGDTALLGPAPWAVGSTSTHATAAAMCIPKTDMRSRSTVVPSAFFVGLDDMSATLTLGHRGWDAGVTIAKELQGEAFDAAAVPVGRVKPSRRNAMVQAGAVVGVSLVLGVALSMLRRGGGGGRRMGAVGAGRRSGAAAVGSRRRGEVG